MKKGDNVRPFDWSYTYRLTPNGLGFFGGVEKFSLKWSIVETNLQLPTDNSNSRSQIMNDTIIYNEVEGYVFIQQRFLKRVCQTCGHTLE